jgi:hypothetical protein
MVGDRRWRGEFLAGVRQGRSPRSDVRLAVEPRAPAFSLHRAGGKHDGAKVADATVCSSAEFDGETLVAPWRALTARRRVAGGGIAVD